MSRIDLDAIDHLKRGAKRWRVRWSDPQPGGSTQPRSECFVSRDEAVLHRDKVFAAIDRARPNVLDRAIGRPGKLAEVIPGYIRGMERRGVTRCSWKNTEACLNWLLDPHRVGQPIRFLHDITLGVLREFIERNWHANADRGRQRLYQVKTFLRKCQEDGFLIDAKVLTLYKAAFGRPRAPERKGVWNEADLLAIMSELTRPYPMGEPMRCGKRSVNGIELNERLYLRNRQAFAPVFLLLLRYALRPITACRLEVRDWIPSQRLLVIRPEAVKNDCGQQLSIDALMASVLDRCAAGRRDGAPLFSAPQSIPEDERPWKRGFMSLVMLQILGRAGVAGSIYRAKHTSCSYLLRTHQADLKLVSMVTGHKDVRQLQIYNMVPDDRQRLVAAGYEAVQGVGSVTSGAPLAAFMARPGSTVMAPLSHDLHGANAAENPRSIADTDEEVIGVA